MNSNFKKAVERYVKQTPLNQELSPGTTGRRYEPKGGVNKHNARIHRESKVSDNKGLDFTFRKPPKPMGRSVYVSCDNCGYVTSGTTATVGFICPECKTFSTVTEVEDNE
jgi:predicted Zn-ribbon and HTH transcriptional regulator